MKFLIDQQLSQALARLIESRGFPARHVMDLGMDAAPDKDIWTYAKAEGFVLVSKDEDFFHLATMDPAASPLVWVRLGNCRKVALLAAFEA